VCQSASRAKISDIKEVTLLEHRKKILGTGLFLLLMAGGSQALTLGRVSSSAVIGRSLDLGIAVQMDAGETAASLCFDADVFHGDARQDPGRVKVLVEPAAQPNMLNVRVLSATAVDEPVVTVYLRTGCGQKTTRRYVLLADFPSELAAPAAPQSAAILSPTTAAAAPVPAVGGIAGLSASAGAVDKVTSSPRAPKSADPQSTRNKRVPAKSSAPASKNAATNSVRPVERLAGQPRLQLDPLDLFSDRIANLDGDMTFEAPPDALESIQKLQTLEESLKSLRLMASKNEASLGDLQARLQKAESSGFSSLASYALMGLSLLCLSAVAVAVVLWRRQRQAQGGQEWWGDAAPAPVVPAVKNVAEIVPQEQAADPVANQWHASVHSQHPSESEFAPQEFKRSGFDVNVDMTEMSDSAFRDFMPTGALSGHASKLADLEPEGVPADRTARNLNSDAVLDIRQQAEFFVSLGQAERAVKLLRREIKESEEANPFVYLDLLALFHSLGLKGEFQQLRESFELLFCCRIPAFTFFKNRSLDLEAYPEVLSHIAEIWSKPGIFDWLESCIFQKPDNSGSPGFDLEAFRDLLFLHSVAWILEEIPVSKGTVGPRRVVPGASVSMQPSPTRQELQPFVTLDLDLDLSRTVNVQAQAFIPDSASWGLVDSSGLITQADQEAETHEDPLVTTLALAEEFRVIGDAEGARTLIDEVIAEATGDIQIKAQFALSKL